MSFPVPPRGEGPTTMAVPPHVARPDPVPRVRSPRVDALGAFPGADRLAAFWDEVAAVGAPLIEDEAGGSCTYTFVHRGAPGTERVALLGNKIADPQTLEHALFEHLPGTDLWWLSLRLGSAWRGSYAIAAQAGPRPEPPEARRALIEQRRARSLAVTDTAGRRSVEEWYELQYYAAPDPLARETARIGGPLPSVAAGPSAPAPIPLRPAETPGRIVPVGDERRAALWWHIPAGPPPDEWEVLVLLDGERWLDSAAALDAWQASEVLPPTIALLVGSGPMEQRVQDLTCSPELVADLVRVLDRAGADAERLFGAPLTSEPARTRIVGQSLGGLTALYAQCAAPQRFGVSVCQSGSFWWPHPDAPGGAEWLTRSIRESEPGLGTVSLEVGLQEWVLLEPTRRLRDALAGSCDRISYREFDGGHDEACWSTTLPELLRETVEVARRD
ncbi:DUF3327 domain-containing protein [Leucobacter sp. CSA1]|uniref:DUF3327 domain-containing protein n=1 Tax=Leucobacter chromiisoli TaxID=2796471 RepID=A0A934USX5_9MICO|nr:enterochelin esterase domain-containing protein [Leucobacter chromiisoli]MBK0417769.1 DUF3327 domain-containing protein [Leucobacter chromiisoli]